MADTNETTTVHTAEVVRYDDLVIITERVAVAAFIAGYTDLTRREGDPVGGPVVMRLGVGC